MGVKLLKREKYRGYTIHFFKNKDSVLAIIKDSDYVEKTSDYFHTKKEAMHKAKQHIDMYF